MVHLSSRWRWIHRTSFVVLFPYSDPTLYWTSLSTLWRLTTTTTTTLWRDWMRIYLLHHATSRCKADRQLCRKSIRISLKLRSGIRQRVCPTEPVLKIDWRKTLRTREDVEKQGQKPQLWAPGVVVGVVVGPYLAPKQPLRKRCTDGRTVLHADARTHVKIMIKGANSGPGSATFWLFRFVNFSLYTSGFQLFVKHFCCTIPLNIPWSLLIFS